jgi:hypothetical protein
MHLAFTCIGIEINIAIYQLLNFELKCCKSKIDIENIDYWPKRKISYKQQTKQTGNSSDDRIVMIHLILSFSSTILQLGKATSPAIMQK